MRRGKIDDMISPRMQLLLNQSGQFFDRIFQLHFSLKEALNDSYKYIQMMTIRSMTFQDFGLRLDDERGKDMKFEDLQRERKTVRILIRLTFIQMTSWLIMRRFMHISHRFSMLIRMTSCVIG
jgi:hypothetical protein